MLVLVLVRYFINCCKKNKHTKKPRGIKTLCFIFTFKAKSVRKRFFSFRTTGRNLISCLKFPSILRARINVASHLLQHFWGVELIEVEGGCKEIFQIDLLLTKSQIGGSNLCDPKIQYIRRQLRNKSQLLSGMEPL